MSKKLLGIGEVYTYDYKQVHKTRNVGFGYYDPNKVSTTSSTDGYVLVDGVLSVVNEDGSSKPEPTPPTPPSWDETTIGDNTWAAENLAYDDGGEGILIVPNVTVNGVNFGTQYYYRSDAVMRLYKNWSNLPFNGWHIATQDEGSLLQNQVADDPLSLMTTSGWDDGMNGNNLNGFNGAPLGYYWDNEGVPTLESLGSQCAFWLYQNGSEEYNDDFDNYMYFGPYGISWDGYDVNKWWFPIRLVKDSE